jgi:nitrate/nitrite transport system ATP-binding protein
MSVRDVRDQANPLSDSASALLELKSVSKHYASDTGTTEVLSDVNLRIAEGEFVAIVGFSGSGKTTLISTIAGLVNPDRGEVLLDGKPVIGAGPERGVVFQSYSLMPWLSVYGNVALAVDAVFPTWTRAQRDEHARKYVASTRWIGARRSCPAACANVWRWRALWRWIRACCCWTSRSLRSMH